ncbi:hypothetical protein F4778DRAFT_780367 [Xylariomycetidae sp. FL2044]|nr:hypothetical protein F4778DRAFT_780367 [Xylariomycetidae sp. FL2044]
MGSSAGQGISPEGFLAVVWTLAAVTTILWIGRLLVRAILVKTFHLDDLFSGLAWFFLIVNVIIVTVFTPISYRFTSVLIGERPMPSPEEFADLAYQFRRWIVSAQVLFWLAIYCVKLSFLLLYKTTLGASKKYNLAWKAALAYILVSFGLCLANVLAWCGGDAGDLLSVAQCGTPYAVTLQGRLIWLAYFFNISSDLVLILLPMPMIWGLQMSARQKLAISAVCCLALITIAFETVRSVKLYQVNNYLTNLYGYLEVLIAVLISMLPSYRFLVSPPDKDAEYRRLFWSRITMRTQHSNSSFSMHNYGRNASAAETDRERDL